MDANKIVECLRATLHPDTREEAEKQLSEAYKIGGFIPILLQVVMSEQLEKDVRLSGVIYLKNTICQFWSNTDAEDNFSILEEDKTIIRDNIVDAIIKAPSYATVQMSVCISQIVKHDYPTQWPNLTNKIGLYLESDQHETWMGSLIALYNLVKNFEYKKNVERDPLNQPMKILLPLLHQRCLQLFREDSELSLLLQKQILKIFSALTQFYLPMDLIDNDTFTRWMELIRLIIEREIPETTESIDIDERPELPCWKIKKWAMSIVYRCFERYGSPSSVQKMYKSFANFYIKSFSQGILNGCFKFLELYRQKVYISPRVLQLTLNYINEGIGHSFSWKIIKPHMSLVLEQIVLPLMCHSEEDNELWTSDPVEYIRMKYDTFEEYFSPVTAAQGLLHSAATGRKEMLPKILNIILCALNNPDLPPPQKAGVLQAIGAIADLLLGKKDLKDNAEEMLVTHVFPEFNSQYGYLRARACWVIHSFCDVKFTQPNNLSQVVMILRTLLVQDPELPVKVEASIALQAILVEQDEAREMLAPHVKDIVIVLLDVIRETVNEDVTTVLQKFVCRFGTYISPLAFDITTHLALTFIEILENEGEPSDERAITAMGLLSTMETMVIVLEEETAALAKVESVLLPVILLIMNQDCMEFYEEMLSLVTSLTCDSISDNMWALYPKLYAFIQADNPEYFSDLAPALHNYISNGGEKFLEKPIHLEMAFTLCKDVLTSRDIEEHEAYAAKLLEVMILQFMNRINNAVPTFVDLALDRLTKTIESPELRGMCLEVVIAALYYDPIMLIGKLEKVHLPNSNESITNQFISQWISDTYNFTGVHDRKLSVIGLCSLISFPVNLRPSAITVQCKQILPSIIHLFAGLDKSYQRFAELQIAEDETDDDEEEDDEANYEDDVVGDDEDVVNEDAFYMQNMENSRNGECEEEEGEIEEDDEYDMTALESYSTPLDGDKTSIDEYLSFKQILHGIQSTDPEWYLSLTSDLNEKQRNSLNSIFRTADQRYATQESKKLEEAKKAGETAAFGFSSGDVQI